MNLFVDLDLLRIVQTPGFSTPVTGFSVRRTDVIALQIQFIQGGAVVDPGAVATSVYWTVKSKGFYSQNPSLISTGVFTKTGTGTSTVYTLSGIRFDTNAINQAFNLASNLPSIFGMMEVAWANADSSLVSRSENADCRIDNNLYSIGGATPQQSGAIWLPTITGLTGGGTTNLDGIPTLPVAVPQLYVARIVVNGQPSSELWVLDTGTDNTSAVAGKVRGVDFDINTNPKVFTRVG